MTDFTQSTGSGGQLKLSLTETSVDVANNKSTVRVTFQIYTPPGSFNTNNNITVSLSGDVTWSSSSFGFTSAGGWHTVYDAYTTFTHDSNGQKSIAVTANMGATGTSGVGGPSSVSSGTFNLSDIVQAPTAPGAPTATRVNDGQVDLSWTNNSATHHEYASQSVQRSVDGAAYATIATGLSAAATSYSDTSTSANHKYTYKIVAVNAAGSATSSAGGAAWTTPGTPTSCAATKLAGGDIEVSWVNNVNYSEYQVDIWESQNGGAYAYVNSVASGNTTWTHVSPSTSVTHKYKVIANKSSSSLYSAYSNETTTITLLATALAPTGLSPSGTARDATANIKLQWTHNPADGTPQTKYQRRWSTDGGATWTTGSVITSSLHEATVTAGTYTNGQTITWQVATAGQNGTIGPWSASASFTCSAVPTVTISTPGATYDTSSLTVDFAYFQAQSSAQAAWQASLYDNASVLLETISGTTETSGTFARVIENGATYTVTVTVTSAAGLASTADSATFTVTYLPPADIAIAGVFDNAAGFVVLTLTGDGAVTDVTEPITTVDVQRQIDGGDWVTILTGVVLDTVSLTATVQDTVPITVGSNNYRAVAYSALPSSVMSDEDEVVTAETTWGYLSGGDSFGTVARFRAMPTFAATSSRAKAVYHFAGRPKPVQLVGEALDSTLTVSGKLSTGSGSAADFEALGQTDGVVCWRGPDGRRVFGSVDKVSTGKTFLAALDTVSFTITELDFTEGDQ